MAAAPNDPGARPTPTDQIKTAIDAGLGLGAPKQIQVHPGTRGLYAIVPEGAKIFGLDEYIDPAPKVTKATFAAYSPAAFIAYMDRHRTPESAVFASVAAAQIVGVVDYHGKAKGVEVDTLANKPGRLVHRAVYDAPVSDQWKLWTGLDGRWMAQGELARFIEENRVDVKEPDGATLLEIVKTLEATKGVNFKSGIRLDNASVDLLFQEQVEGKAGPDGKLTIPTEIGLVIPVFYDGDPYLIKAFFRYKIEAARLSLKIDLHRKQETYDTAFRDIVAKIETELGEATPVYEGALADSAE